MSYCVNCGVELDQSSKECPLCNTPIVNPKDLLQGMGTTPYPKEKGTVETVKRKDLGIFVSVVLLSTAVTCGVLNVFLNPQTLWSLTVIGVCAIMWVMFIPAFIYTKQTIYVSLLLDGAVVAVYLYMIAYMVSSDHWFWGLGLPIVIMITIVAEIFSFCLRKLPKAFLTVSLYIFTAIGIVCVGLEILIDYYLTESISLLWSAVVLTVCIIIDIAIITLLSRKRLRNAVRRRLHF